MYFMNFRNWLMLLLLYWMRFNGMIKIIVSAKLCGDMKCINTESEFPIECMRIRHVTRAISNDETAFGASDWITAIKRQTWTCQIRMSGELNKCKILVVTLMNMQNGTNIDCNRAIDIQKIAMNRNVHLCNERHSKRTNETHSHLHTNINSLNNGLSWGLVVCVYVLCDYDCGLYAYNHSHAWEHKLDLTSWCRY